MLCASVQSRTTALASTALDEHGVEQVRVSHQGSDHHVCEVEDILGWSSIMDRGAMVHEERLCDMDEVK